jgi:hypothetical protein
MLDGRLADGRLARCELSNSEETHWSCCRAQPGLKQQPVGVGRSVPRMTG